MNWQKVKQWIAPAYYIRRLRKKAIKEMLYFYPEKYNVPSKRKAMEIIMDNAATNYLLSNSEENSKKQIEIIKENMLELLDILSDLDALHIFT